MIQFQPQPKNPLYAARAARAAQVLATYRFTAGRVHGKRIVLLASPAGQMYRCSADHRCTCADFAARCEPAGIPCKHLQAAYDWLRAQKAHRSATAPADVASAPAQASEDQRPPRKRLASPEVLAERHAAILRGGPDAVCWREYAPELSA